MGVYTLGKSSDVMSITGGKDIGVPSPQRDPWPATFRGYNFIMMCCSIPTEVGDHRAPSASPLRPPLLYPDHPRAEIHHCQRR